MDHRLRLLDLLDFNPDQGTIYNSSERMLVQSAAAMGLLRKELIEAFGLDKARRLLLRFGYSHGYHDGLSARQRFGDMEPADASAMGFALHTLEGMAQVELVSAGQSPDSKYQVEAILRNSFEAEQHLTHLGVGTSPVCWSTIGYACGYERGVSGRDFYFREVMCTGKGDPYCRVIGRDAESWGDELAAIRADFAPITMPLEQDGAGVLRAELDRLRVTSRIQFEQLLRHEQRLAGQAAESDGSRARALAAAEKAGFVVKSTAMADVLEQAVRIAPLDTTVLVSGESGTGKEFLVNLIHQQSTRAHKPLFTVNCAAMSETLLDSEFFGHARGSFTGAVRDNIGIFEQAAQGTLFLDEIGEMHPSLQAKLLRAIENGEIRRVGGGRPIKVEARIVAATNRNLQQAVASGAFRQDLFYRISGFLISVPPLRERPEEISFLVEKFLRESAEKLAQPVRSVSAAAMARLVRYSWPGNVRELRHAVERAAVIAKGAVIEPADLPPEIISAQDNLKEDLPDLRQDLHTLERSLIERTLQQYQGRRVDAARALNIDTTTLWRKMKRYGLAEKRS